MHEHINTYITESFVGLCTHSSVELHKNILHVVRLGGGGGEMVHVSGGRGFVWGFR